MAALDGPDEILDGGSRRVARHFADASLDAGWDGSLRGLPSTTSSASDFSAVGAAVLALRPIGIAQVGLLVLVLVATPVVRVMASVVAFVLERDRLYAAITLGVLAILLGSLFCLRQARIAASAHLPRAWRTDP